MKFRKAITYSGRDILGKINVTYKIDGCRVLCNPRGELLSRNGKIFPGLEIALTGGAKELIRLTKDCEVYTGSFNETTSILQTKKPLVDCITVEDVYPLDTNDTYDMRLHVRTCNSIIREEVEADLDVAIGLGYEGIIIRTDTHWYRVKATYTADVIITGFREQKDKWDIPKKCLGGFTSKYGHTSAFSDLERFNLWKNPKQYIGRMMEVSYKELYANGSFRFGTKFIRFRDDKEDESFDTQTMSYLP